MEVNPLSRRPFRSHTMRSVARILSHVPPEDNPFPELAALLPTPFSSPVREALAVALKKVSQAMSGDVGGSSAPITEEVPRSDEVGGDSATGVDGKCTGNLSGLDGSSDRTDRKDDKNAGVLSETDGLSGVKMNIDESQIVQDIIDQPAEVQNGSEDFLGIERILMDDSDDEGLLQFQGNDAALSMFNDLCSMTDTENREQLVEMEMEVDVEAEKMRKNDSETINASVGGDWVNLHAHVPVEREISSCLEVGNQSTGTCSEDIGSKEREVLSRKILENLAGTGGFTFSAQQSQSKGGKISTDKSNANLQKGPELGTAAKGKTKKGKDLVSKGVKSGKTKKKSLPVEAINRKIIGDTDPVVSGKLPKPVVSGSKDNTAVVSKLGAKNSESVQYSRTQLLHLRQVAAVHGDVLRVVKEIEAEMCGGAPSLAAKKTINVSASNNGQLGTCAGDEKAEEQISGILKKKRQGCTEAKKEKKKRQKRKKRAELNKKLGVKRLKLRPLMKPTVVQPCRHYLKGRCQEGENCKFSHDVIPETKSKPCCHFARQACMKGNDCPFDHQLSKYPCNNIVSTGFCVRGESCSFSHKIPAKEGIAPTLGVSKEQLDKSNCKQLNAISFSPGITVQKNMTENSVIHTNQHAKSGAGPYQVAKPAVQTIHPAMPPKGVSFLSLGKSALNNSTSQKDRDLSGLGVQPNPKLPGLGAKMSKVWLEYPASPTPEGEDVASLKRTSVGSSGYKNQGSPLTHSDGLSILSRNSLSQESAKNENVGSTKRIDVIGTTDNQRNQQNSSGQELNTCQFFAGASTPITRKGIAISSSGPANSNSGTSEHRRFVESDKLKAPEPLSFPSPPGQFSIGIGGPVKGKSDSAQREHSFASAFAAKFEAGIKKNPASTEASKDEGTSSASQTQEKPKASAFLDFLFRGDRN